MIGYDCGTTINTGDFNSAYGADALKLLTSGSYNSVFGVEAMDTATTAEKNVVMGYRAATNATSCTNSVFIGHECASVLTSGSHNTIVGGGCGHDLTTGGYNTLVGYKAGSEGSSTKLTTGSNNLLLGHDSAPSSESVSNEITLGDANITKFRIPGINVVLKDNGGTPTTGHVLTVDGSGEASFAAASGGSSLNADNLDSGTIPNGRFPATLPATSGANLTSLTAGNISGTLATGQIADNAVTFAKMQDVGTGVLIGRNDGGSGDMETLSASEVRTLLNVADGATAGITTAAENVQVTWSVTANGSSAYRFTGPGNDGSEDNPDLYLVRGQRYRFINNSGGTNHPFEIRSSAGGSAYNDGVTNNGASTGSASKNIDFNVQHDAPTRLYYQCTSCLLYTSPSPRDS